MYLYLYIVKKNWKFDWILIEINEDKWIFTYNLFFSILASISYFIIPPNGYLANLDFLFQSFPWKWNTVSMTGYNCPVPRIFDVGKKSLKEPRMWINREPSLGASSLYRHRRRSNYCIKYAILCEITKRCSLIWKQALSSSWDLLKKIAKLEWFLEWLFLIRGILEHYYKG